MVLVLMLVCESEDCIMCIFLKLYNYDKLLVAQPFPSGISLSLSKAKNILYFQK